jgi:transposase
VLDVENWAEVRRLYRSEGLPIREIARVMGVPGNTVRAAIASDGPPKYQRPPAGSVVDVAEPRIRELLKSYPRMPATVIAERIGWERSIRVLSGRVAELRPAYLPPDPASRTAYAAGEIAQCDFWFPDVTLPAGFGQVRTAKRLPVAGDGDGVLAVALSGAGPVPAGGGPVRRLVAADRGAGGGAAGAGVGRGGRDRPVAGGKGGADG